MLCWDIDMIDSRDLDLGVEDLDLDLESNIWTCTWELRTWKNLDLDSDSEDLTISLIYQRD